MYFSMTFSFGIIHIKIKKINKIGVTCFSKSCHNVTLILNIMKKVTVDFSDLSTEVIKAVALIYKDGFKQSDVIRFSEVDKEMDDRVKVILNNTLFLIKMEYANDIISGVYNDDTFMIPTKDDEPCEGDYCE